MSTRCQPLQGMIIHQHNKSCDVDFEVSDENYKSIIREHLRVITKLAVGGQFNKCMLLILSNDIILNHFYKQHTFPSFRIQFY